MCSSTFTSRCKKIRVLNSYQIDFNLLSVGKWLRKKETRAGEMPVTPRENYHPGLKTDSRRMWGQKNNGSLSPLSVCFNSSWIDRACRTCASTASCKVTRNFVRSRNPITPAFPLPYHFPFLSFLLSGPIGDLSAEVYRFQDAATTQPYFRV